MNNIKQCKNQYLNPLFKPVLSIVLYLSFAVVLSQVAYSTQVLAQSSVVKNNSAADQLTLGNPFLQEKGKITVQRVTGITNGLPRIETSFSANDTINGNVTAKDIGTYVTTPRPNSGTDVLTGEGQGVITTSKGGQMATWTGQGIGHFTSDGKIIFHGSLFLVLLRLAN